MDIGLSVVVTSRTGDLVALARRIEAVGFESLWIPDHPVIPSVFTRPFPIGAELPEHYGRWIEQFVALTVAATATTRLKIATGVCLLAERHPLLTAKAVASLDCCSGGRVLLGVGAGWNKEEVEVMGTPFHLRWRRLRETAEALRLLWTQPSPSYAGSLVQFPALRCEPKPLQPNGPPILLGAHGPKAWARVAKTYDGWCPIVADPDTFKQEVTALRQLTREAGRDPDALQLSPFVDPQDGHLSLDAIKAYQQAGASRVILFSERALAEMADGQATEWVERLAPIVERARGL